VQVSALRKLLGSKAIATVPGRGYRFTARVVEKIACIAREQQTEPELREPVTTAASTANVGDAARLMASIYVSYVDAIGACFEAKYHYQTWRPTSAIQLTDAAWTPVLPTPNHPEYPAAHSCTSGALGEALRNHYGTPNVSFTWDNSVSATTRSYAGIDAFNAEAGMARIHGGMHFSHSTAAGEALGRRVAQWVASRHFARQD
jgi:PAP2 superfamily